MRPDGDVSRGGGPSGADRASPQDPRSLFPAGLLTRASAALQHGNPNEAEGLCRRLLEVQPEHGEALRVLGVIQQKRGLFADAERLIRRALLGGPGCPSAHTALAEVLMGQGRYEEAVPAYRQALRLQPRDTMAYVGLGAALEHLGDLPEAADTYQQAVQWRSEGNGQVHFLLGEVLTRLGRFEEAVHAYRTGLDRDPDHLDSIRALGTLMHRLGRVAEAQALFGDAVFRMDRADTLPLLEHWLGLMPDDPVANHRWTAWLGQEAPARACDAYVTWLFDHYADRFDDHLRQLGYRAPTLIAARLTGLLGEGRGQLDVLDAGCGTGLCGPILRPHARRLTGVDLSPRMMDRAREQGGYDELVVDELTAFLEGHRLAFDLVVSADTLVYFGELDAVLTAAAHALRPGGHLAFTVEEAEGTEAAHYHRLNRSGRYSHTAEYLDRALAGAGLSVETMEPVTLRQEGEEGVRGFVVLARRPAL